jgi:hypothetical protein
MLRFLHPPHSLSPDHAYRAVNKFSGHGRPHMNQREQYNFMIGITGY